jgi:hypothetical protein
MSSSLFGGTRTQWTADSNARPPSSRPSVAAVAGFLFVLFVGLYILAYTSPVKMGPPIAAAVRYLFFPSAGLGLALVVGARLLAAEARRSRLQTLAWILLLAPVAAVIAYAEKSSVLFLHYEAIIVVFPFVLAAIGLAGSYRIASGRTSSRTSPAGLALGALGLIAVGAVWSPPLLRDLLLPPATVEGAISGKMEARKPRRAYSGAITSYQIKIDGAPRWRTRKVGTETFNERIVWYYVTRDVFTELREGDRIRGLARAGTDVLLNVEKRY